jgi:hypothetical protein
MADNSRAIKSIVNMCAMKENIWYEKHHCVCKTLYIWPDLKFPALRTLFRRDKYQNKCLNWSMRLKKVLIKQFFKNVSIVDYILLFLTNHIENKAHNYLQKRCHSFYWDQLQHKMRWTNLYDLYFCATFGPYI